MKRLICAKDVEALCKQGEKIFYIDEETIVTSSAKDAANVNNITFKNRDTSAECDKDDNLDKDMIYKVCKAMVENGLIKNLDTCDTPYEVERDKSGLKMVRGETVQFNVLDPEQPEIKASYQELVGKEESHISAGFLVIDKGRFDWTLNYEEIDYVIDGTLTIEIDGKTYVGYKGDVLYVPSGSKVVWGSPDKATLFYATYPANWTDLL